MKMQHSPFHWIAVALITAVALFTLNEAWGAGAPGGSDGVKPVTPGNDRSVLPQRDRDDGAVTKQSRALGKAKRAAKKVVRKERGVE